MAAMVPIASIASPSNTQQSWVSSTPLGRPVVPGGVDQRGEVVALNGPCPFFKSTTIRIVDRLPQRLEGIQGDDPAVRTSLALDDHDLLDRGDVGSLFEQLVHLPLVFRKDHSTLGVGDDVSTLIGGVRRVDGRGCAACTQDADIRKNPLDARSR